MHRSLASNAGLVLLTYESLYILRSKLRFILRQKFSLVLPLTAFLLRIEHRKDETCTCYFHVHRMCLHL